ncbi:MAG: DUF2298 domain-containing protein, partial [Armatimonadota bacterium]|nr:DUF2298 domain-containing protein [Armatimonadota bacterium]
MPFFPFVSWLLLIWLLGWFALPVARRIWGNDAAGLPDAGLAAGRVLLLTLWTLAAFWAGYLGVATRWSAFFIVPLGMLCGWLARRDWPLLQAVVRARRRGMVVAEAVFLAVFFLFFLFRGFWPDINNGEKPMDMALIAACARADQLPPPNPYAASERLSSYYYLGHFQTALLTKASGSIPRWTYNLICATLPALCFSTLVALCSAVTGRLRNGVLAATCVLALGTLEPLRQWANRLGPLREWSVSNLWPLDYFSTSRVIPFMADGQPHYTINEYPWFTFNYADLHAHYFAMPLALLLLSLGWALYGRMTDGGSRPPVVALLCGLALGALIVTNTWDFPAYTLVVTLCLMRFRAALRRNGPRLATAMGMVVVALLVATPFLFRLEIANGLPRLIRRLHTEASLPQLLDQPASPTGDWLLMWGPLVGVWILTSILAERRPLIAEAAPPHEPVLRLFLARRRAMIFSLLAPIVLWLLLLLMPGRDYLVSWSFWPPLVNASGLSAAEATAVLHQRPPHTFLISTGRDYFVLLLLLTLTFWTARAAFRHDDPLHGWLCRVALCGLLALCWSETTWAGFLGPPYHRQDTVFKFGLQAWYLLGTA